MDARDARLRGIPRSRDTIASLDPQHDPRSKRARSSQTRTNKKLDRRISVSRVWPRIHLEASRTCDGVDLPRATTPAVPLRTRPRSRSFCLVVIFSDKADVSLVIGINVKDHLHELAAAMHHPKAQNLERAAVLLVNPHNVRHWCDPAR